MPDEHIPKHLRGLPPGAREQLTLEDERFLQDLRAEAERTERRVRAEGEAWAFPVPRPMALLFDRLPSPFTVEQALADGEALDLDAADVAEALHTMRRLELVSDAPSRDGAASYVRHPENRNWF